MSGSVVQNVGSLTATWATGAGGTPAAGGTAMCAAIAAATACVIWHWIAASVAAMDAAAASAFMIPAKNVWHGVGVGGGGCKKEDDDKLWLEWNSTTTQNCNTKRTMN